MTARCSLSTERQHWQNQESDIPSIPARHEFRIIQVHPWVYPCDGPIACGCESHLYLSMYLSTCLLACLPTYLPTYPPTYLSTYPIYQSLSIYLAVCLSVYIYLSISLSPPPSSSRRFSIGFHPLQHIVLLGGLCSMELKNSKNI